MSSPSQDIGALEHKIRDTLLYPSIFKYLRSKEKAHERICALLDFIGDSEAALATVDTTEKRGRLEPYFLAYGLLQTTSARQVALRQVLLDLEIPVPAGLLDKSATKPRDRVIGHPITSDGGSHVILRNTLNPDGFEFVSYYGSETRRGNLVNYDSLLREHEKAMREGLNLLYSKLADIENQRRREMSKNPLTPMLRGVDYIAECLAAAMVEPKYQAVIEANASMLAEALVPVRASLAARVGDADAAYYVDSIVEGTVMLRELYPFEDEKQRLRFEIIATGIKFRTKELLRMARDIDETEAKDLS
jgi:hypothetical protein